MKKPMFDDWDHFKGDFKSRPEKSEYEGEIVVEYPHMVDIASITYNKLMKNSNYGFFGGANITVPNQISFTQLGDPSKCATIYGFGLDEELIDDTPICDHDPIDVGFAQPKMVCRKCDKDL